MEPGTTESIMVFSSQKNSRRQGLGTICRSVSQGIAEVWAVTTTESLGKLSGLSEQKQTRSVYLSGIVLLWWLAFQLPALATSQKHGCAHLDLLKRVIGQATVRSLSQVLHKTKRREHSRPGVSNLNFVLIQKNGFV